MNTGTKLATMVRTCVEVVSHVQWMRAARMTAGTCTANCSRLPPTEPQASNTASRGGDVVGPKAISVATIAAFHTTGAAYDSRNLWWLLRMPRHHADTTNHPVPG